MMGKNSKIPILYVSKEECCGCSACEAICPIGAIKMVLDEDGFYYPKAAADICIFCGQCMRVCAFKKEIE